MENKTPDESKKMGRREFITWTAAGLLTGAGLAAGMNAINGTPEERFRHKLNEITKEELHKVDEYNKAEALSETEADNTKRKYWSMTQEQRMKHAEQEVAAESKFSRIAEGTAFLLAAVSGTAIGFEKYKRITKEKEKI